MVGRVVVFLLGDVVGRVVGFLIGDVVGRVVGILTGDVEGEPVVGGPLSGERVGNADGLIGAYVGLLVTCGGVWPT